MTSFLPGAPNPDFKVYVDMDGVLTDFSKAVHAIGAEYGLGPKSSEEDKNKMYEAIENAGVDFWSNMPWMPDGKSLWKVVMPFYPRIITSPGLFQYAKQGKKEWVNHNIPGTPLFFSDHKLEFVEPYTTCVLIDDMERNILPWREAGGIGIQHKSSEQTEKELLSLLYRS